MQWLINEFKSFKEEVVQTIDAAVDSWAQKQLRAAEDIEQLRGEIKAMKMRMGKKE